MRDERRGRGRVVVDSEDIFTSLSLSLSLFVSPHFFHLFPYLLHSPYSFIMDALDCSARLDMLPLEIIFAIIDLLSMKDVMNLSQVNKYLRGSSLPYLFRRIAITFSLDGFKQLKEISESPIRLHVVSLKYVVPELIEPGKQYALNIPIQYPR